MHNDPLQGIFFDQPSTIDLAPYSYRQRMIRAFIARKKNLWQIPSARTKTGLGFVLPNALKLDERHRAELLDELLDRFKTPL